MNTLQLTIYYGLKIIVRFFFRLYFPKTLVKGKENLRLNGPTLVVSNHPNTLIDALNAAIRVSEPVFFLANAGIYMNALISRLLGFFYCIRVERPQDTNGRPINNDHAFDLCFQHLRMGRHIYIAPEGGSFMERRLRPLRTGTARIALGAEESTGFTLGVRILPIGLTYSSPDKSGGNLAVQAGPVIYAKDWEQLYREDARQAIKSLTEHIEVRLRELIIDTRDVEEDAFLASLESILDAEQPLPVDQYYQRSQKLLGFLRNWEYSAKEDFERFRQELHNYKALLDNYGLKESSLAPPKLSGPGDFMKASGFLPAFWIPLWLLGWIHHVLPFEFIRSLPEKMKVYIGYTTTVKWVGAFFLLPIWYALLAWLASWYIPGLEVMVYILCVLLSGSFFLLFKPRWINLSAAIKAKAFQRKHPEVWKVLNEKRDRILAQVMVPG